MSINGSTVAGKSYAEVVQQIQKTPDRLHLLVVPGEEDIIQQVALVSYLYTFKDCIPLVTYIIVVSVL